jgi:Zn-dependent M16 (insulinase) family peptidase
MNTLITYLSESSVSILENVLVEQEELASEISIYVSERPKSVVTFIAEGVATEKADKVAERILELMESVVDNKLDMEYMRQCIARKRRTALLKAEQSYQFFSEIVLVDFLFGPRDGSELVKIKDLEIFDTLEAWTEDQWKTYIRTWFIDAKHITLIGKPSAKLAEQLKAEEEARVKKQQDDLGDEGLKRLQEKLDHAKNDSNKEIPRDILKKFKIPSTESIHFHETKSAVAGLAKSSDVQHSDSKIQKLIDSDPADISLYLHFEHQPTKFVYASIILGSGSIPVELRPLLPLFIDNFFNTPITRDGKRIEFEQVVAELENDTISYDISDDGDNPELISISLTFEPEKYGKVVQWLNELLWNSVFDEKRLSASISKMIAEIPLIKRDGADMLSAVDNMIHLSKESIGRAQSSLVKALYLKRIKSLLQSSPEKVISQLEELRTLFFKPENLRVLIVADVKDLQNPVSTWKEFVAGQDKASKVLPLDHRRDRLSAAGQKPGQHTYIVPIAATDSSYLSSTVRGPDSPIHPDLPALMVAIAYLEMAEGPLWGAVRGTGLAYGTWFILSEDWGYLTYKIYRSPDAYKAFLASKQIIEDYISGAAEFNVESLEGAVSTNVVAIVDKQQSMMAAARSSFVNKVIRNLPQDHDAELLKRISKVDVEQIKAAMKNIILPLFQPGQADVIVTCATVMQEVNYRR